MLRTKNIFLFSLCLLVIAGSIFLGVQLQGKVQPKEPQASSQAESTGTGDGGESSSERENHSSEPSLSDPGEAMPEVTGIFSDYCAQAREKAASMTLEEKVGQVFLARYPDKEQAADEIRHYHPGGYVLFAKDFKDKNKSQVKNELSSCQAASSIPLILGVDEEGGMVVRVSSNTALSPKRFRSPQSLYKEGGMAAVQQDARDKSQLLLELGLNLNLAPVADVSTARRDFIHSRSFGMSAQATASYVSNVIKVMNQEGISSALKHFPGYGNNTDTHTGIAVDKRGYSQFQQEDFLPFQAGIQEGAPCVLVSHIIVESMDPDHPASLSAKVHEILRDTLGFTGIIMTDDLAMEAISSYTAGQDAAVTAFLAGNDVLLCSSLEQSYQALLQAVQDGTVTEERLNESVTRILAWKYSKGVLKG